MEERGCFKCGNKTGGNLRKHVKDCPYIKELCDKYSVIKEFVEGREPQWTRKDSRSNKKH